VTRIDQVLTKATLQKVARWTRQLRRCLKMASSVGAAAALTKGNEQGGAPAFGCWRGSEDELQRLRASGVDGLIIKNACRGDVGRGAHLKLPSPAAVLVTKQVIATDDVT
jgi:hypothetical protein